MQARITESTVYLEQRGVRFWTPYPGDGGVYITEYAPHLRYHSLQALVTGIDSMLTQKNAIIFGMVATLIAFLFPPQASVHESFRGGFEGWAFIGSVPLTLALMYHF